MSAASSFAGTRRVSFRFGLSAQRWGVAGRPVLLLADRGAPPELVGSLVGTGHQVFALDPAGESEAESAAALQEAAVELPPLAVIVALGKSACAATHRALANGLTADHVALYP